MPLSLVPFALLALPFVEIAVFILVGSEIGVLPTLLLVVATTIVGGVLLRIQGFGVLRQIRATTDAGGAPGRELVHGVMILLAGLLLIVPGFVSDTLGLLLFIPPLREAAWRLLRDRITILGGMTGEAAHHGRGPPGRTIDLDASDYSAGPRKDSPWLGPDRDRP